MQTKNLARAKLTFDVIGRVLATAAPPKKSIAYFNEFNFQSLLHFLYQTLLIQRSYSKPLKNYIK